MGLFEAVYNMSRKYRGGSFLLRLLFGCDIPREAAIGNNVNFAHRGLGTVSYTHLFQGFFLFESLHSWTVIKNKRSKKYLTWEITS